MSDAKSKGYVFFWLLFTSVYVGCSSSQSKTGIIRKKTIESLYNRIGGASALRSLVDDWILEASTDREIQNYFVHAKIHTLKLRIAERICIQIGGPCLYQGRAISKVHQNMMIDSNHLQAFMQGFSVALKRSAIPGSAHNELRDAVYEIAERVVGVE